MILQALANHYKILLEDEKSGVSPPGYSRAGVSFAAIISKEGELLDLEDLRVQKGKKLVSRDMVVPEQLKKANGIASNFLCENASYFFGLSAIDQSEKSKKKFESFRELHQVILENAKSEDAKILLLFFKKWDAVSAVNHRVIEKNKEELLTANIVFKIEGSLKYVHEIPEVKQAWSFYKGSQLSDIVGQCLMTGKNLPLARLHPSVKGVSGSQSVGASIVSFNLESFKSYGKDQSFNAPVSEEATFAYTTALNYLLNSEKNRLRIGDTTTVFWAECSSNGLEEAIFAELFDPSSVSGDDNVEDEKKKDEKGRIRDPHAVQIVKKVLGKLKNGEKIYEAATEINLDTKFFILGLSPNVARLSIRFWYEDTFGALFERMIQHQLDMEIERPEKLGVSIPTWMVLKEMAVQHDLKNLSPLLAGNFSKSIISGQCYGESIYNQMIGRIRADREVNAVRAGMIKACMKRRARKYGEYEKEALFTVSLNERNENKGYRLGRLFAVLEKAQLDVSPKLNATIKDRYFGAASATPASVFPTLVKLSQHHMSKSEYGYARDREIKEILQGVDAFPAHLNLENQGQFVLGYYHQKQAFFKKNTTEEIVE